MKTPTEALDEILYRSGLYVTRASVIGIMSELRAAGFIIVRHDAIRLAQSYARAEMRDSK